MTSTCTSAHQRHGEHAHAQLLVHLALLVCDTVALRACPWQPYTLRPGVARVRHGGLASLSLAALYARTWWELNNVTRSGQTVIRSLAVRAQQSCRVAELLDENASRQQTREECAHDDGGVGTRANLPMEVKGGRGGRTHVDAGRWIAQSRAGLDETGCLINYDLIKSGHGDLHSRRRRETRVGCMATTLYGKRHAHHTANA